MDLPPFSLEVAPRCGPRGSRKRFATSAITRGARAVRLGLPLQAGNNSERFRRDSGLGGFCLELKADLVSYTRKGSQWKGSIFVIVTVSGRASERHGSSLFECGQAPRRGRTWRRGRQYLLRLLQVQRDCVHFGSASAHSRLWGFLQSTGTHHQRPERHANS
jgi:hypothetical protein